MKDGFIKIACATPELKVADCDYNADKIIELIKKAYSEDVKIVCFPELSLTGYTCGDLFLQNALLESVKENLIRIADETGELDIISIVGAPLRCVDKLYNCAVVISKGDFTGGTAKHNIPNYSEFYEARHFTQFDDTPFSVVFKNDKRRINIENHIFCNSDMPEFSFGIEICEDLWVGNSPSVELAESGANIIFNLSASDETIGKAEYRRTLVKAKSGSLCCAYAYSDAGVGESTTDMTFAGHNIIAENGSVLAESKLFENGLTIADVDVQKLAYDRQRMTTFNHYVPEMINTFHMDITETKLDRVFPQTPFVPSSKSDLEQRCEEILTIQSVGLTTRIKHIGCKDVVLGLSGGLDSTLALIVCVHAFERLGLDRKGIHAITMPCFGTTDRTYNNACRLSEAYGTSLEEINIMKSVNQHFKDISHNPDIHDVTYENSQARERTQILMDKANQYNGIVIGTGDLSELALGWATYNGDHMSMYAVNASVPKTLVRWLVNYESGISEGELKTVLLDILETPVSPELLPPDESGKISQRTEDLVGPYELHDFFLYYMMRFGFSPSKIFRIACMSFRDKYTPQTIMKWEKKFYWRFFSQQFKRSCLPDGPKVGSVTLSPRGDWRMPSDASVNIWLKELEKIKI